MPESSDLSNLQHNTLEEAAPSGLDLLEKASFEILGEKDLKESSDIILDYSLQLTESAYGFVCTQNPNGDLLIVSLKGMDGSNCRADKSPFMFKTLKGLHSAVIEKQEPVLSNDLASDPRSMGLPEEYPSISSFLGVPLIVGGSIFGSICVANRPGGYGTNERSLLSTFANCVSMALGRRKAEGKVQMLLSKLSLAQSLLEQQVEERTSDLKRSEKMYQDLYENAPDMYLTVSPAGTILNCNQTGLKLLGYAQEDFYGKSIFDFMTESCRKTCPAHLMEIFEKGKVEDIEVELLNKKGEVLTFNVNATAVHDSKGEPLMTRGVWRDITTKKRLEQQLIHSQKMESLGTLAGGIAHDFNNILGGVIGYASYIKDLPGIDEKIVPFLKIIEKSAFRAAELADRILTFARRSDNKMQPFALPPLIEETCMLLEKRIEKNVTIVRKFRAQDACVLGESAQIQQVIMNICINACDSMPQGGTLTVETENIRLDSDDSSGAVGLTPGDYVETMIIDTGAGITPEIRNQIFDPFFTTKKPGKGTGLGLAMAYGIVKSHGGHIEVASTPGEGSSFRILLPLCLEVPMEELSCSDSSAPSGAPKERATILVVDDESVIRDLARNILTREGYHVILAKDGEAGCKIFQKEKDAIDLVILDLVMPGMSGKETYEELHHLSPQIRVVFSTGYSKDDPLLEIGPEDKTGFVQKPYNIDMLLEEVHRVLSL